MKTLLKGGRVVSGAGVRPADVLLEGERIAAVGAEMTAPGAEAVDCTGKLLFPGFIDAHTHFDLEVCGTITAVTDRDAIIAVAGGGKRELLGKRISPQLEQIMEDRRIYQHAGEERSVFVTESGDKYRTAVAAPIISEGDVLGLVLFVEDGENLVTGETEYKLAQTIAAFLGKHMES